MRLRVSDNRRFLVTDEGAPFFYLGDTAWELFHRLNRGYLDDYDVRRSAYWALFAGAHGHTYGCHDIWQFYEPGRAPISWARTSWREAIHLPGAGQMQYARRLLERHPFDTRIPDQSLVVAGQGQGEEHVAATRDAEATYALAYLPSGRPAAFDLGKLAGGSVRASWYDPRTGASLAIGEFAGGVREFAPPSSGRGNDWVLEMVAGEEGKVSS